MSKTLLASDLIQSMCEKELRSIEESQDDFVSRWRKESN